MVCFKTLKCLILIKSFVESEKVLGNVKQNSNYQNKNNVFGQRLRRNVQRRFKRDFDGVSGGDGSDSGSNGYANNDANSIPQNNNLGGDSGNNVYQNPQDANQGGISVGDNNAGGGSMGSYQR